MRKSVIVILGVVVVLTIGGIFHLNHKEQAETGFKDGVKMNYLCGFNDRRDGKPFNPDGVRAFVPTEDNAMYNKGFLVGAAKSYQRGYASGKEKGSQPLISLKKQISRALRKPEPSWKEDSTEEPRMTTCIPSGVAAIDSNDNGKIDRMYVGNLNGYVRRLKMSDPDPSI